MKSGFVMLAGRSNVGKSTLLNALIGTKVSIVTPKPQTTRHPVRGILHDPRAQIVFVDTPGLFLGRKDLVSNKLNEFVHDTLTGVDVVVYVMDPTREPGAEEERIQELVRRSPVPVIAVINKIDQTDAVALNTFRNTDVGAMIKLEVSAAKHKHLNKIVDAIVSLLPEGGDLHYPEHQLTDVGHREWMEEIIREKIFLELHEELPYSIKVSVDEIEKRKDGSRFVAGTIWTTEERYKRMIIGAKASTIKHIGMLARKEIEQATNMKTFLELMVRVDPKWPQRFV